MLTSARYAALSDASEVLFVRLMLCCDDEGRTLGDLRLLKAWLYPVRDRVDLEAIERGLVELEDAGYIVRYVGDGRALIQVVDWSEFQKPNRARPSDYPGPNGEESMTSHGGGSDSCMTGEGEGEGEGGTEGGRAPAAPSRHAARRGTRLPEEFTVTVEMAQWAQERFPDVDRRLETEKFVDHFRSVPGSRGLKLDWVLTWRNWIRRAAEGRR